VVTTSAIRKVLPHLEFGYAVIALFALTQGPVYRLWGESAESLVVSSRTSLAHVYFATFTAVQLPALVVVSRTFTVEMLRNRSIQALIALHLWLGCTVLWSTLARHSLPEFLALVLTTSFGVFLALRFRPLQFWWIVLLAMMIGLLLSVLAVYRVWDTARDLNDGFWIGIYYNRNSLAPVAGVALVAAMSVVVVGKRLTGSQRLANLIGATFVGGFSVLIVVQAESRTTPIALTLTVLILGLWQIYRALLGKWANGFLTRCGAATLAVGTVAICILVALRNFAKVSGLSGETTTFNSRAGLWSQNWTGFLEKPLQGWGWMAARQTKDFFQQGIYWAAFPTEWSHNGYHDLLLGGGMVAGSLFVVFLALALGHFDRELSWSDSLANIGLVGFVLVAAIQESFFIGSHFMWALLMGCLLRGAIVSANRPLINHEYARKSSP